MMHKDLKKLIRSVWPSLRKPFFGIDPITCRDVDYPEVYAEHYINTDRIVWEAVKSLGASYGNEFPDCDDFSDIKLGLFKIEWFKLIQNGFVNFKTPPCYAVCDGYNPDGAMHDFNAFVSGGKLYVSDYGQIVQPDGYKPILMRF